MKLGIGDIIRSAAIAIWRGGRQISVCLALWACAEWAFGALRRVFDPLSRLLFTDRALEYLDIRSQGMGGYDWTGHLIKDGLHNAVTCVFIAAIFRIILLGNASLLSADPGGFARAAGRILLASLAVTVVLNALFWLSSAGAVCLGARGRN